MIFGYLDPGSGSLLLQAVIGGATGLAVAVKALRHRYRFGQAMKAADPNTVEPAETVEDTALPAES